MQNLFTTISRTSELTTLKKVFYIIASVDPHFVDFIVELHEMNAFFL